eukprot:TRINITY_DN29471_c0_g1_i1.p1 TRINITY_DN29471_c0_g1~~TRINITY_DN29471_c0_g1_i1.p1  ORF type:complete len:885 (+),score=167.70 TRINITY_DN29471_c0_g1_i1:254-2908(+)
MAEFARWQWDDLGTWRDFAEQFQAEMEAVFQNKAQSSLELVIPPFGTFCMNIQKMTQTTLKGNNPGFSRSIRRQVKTVDVGYFLLGHTGDIIASDSPIDQITEERVLEHLLDILRRIVDEPEEFDHRSINLEQDPFEESVGCCEEAVEYLSEKGFEVINDGGVEFLLYLNDDTVGLKVACEEVGARLTTVQNLASQAPPTSCAVQASTSTVASFSNVVNSGAAASSVANPRSIAESKIGNEDQAASSRCGEGRRNDTKSDGPRKKRGKGRGRRRSNQMVWRLKALAATVADDTSAAGASTAHLPSNAMCEPSDDPPHLSSKCDVQSDIGEFSPSRRETAETGPLELVLVLTGSTKIVSLQDGTLEELLKEAKKASGFRFPRPRFENRGDCERPIGLAAEPGLKLRDVARVENGERVEIEDFEATFVEKMQGGLLRLEDVASSAPLLDWDKAELTNLVLGRLRSHLEGSSEAWCKAASCKVEHELAYGRALLRLLFAGKALDARLELCRRLLPSEKRDEKIIVRVDRDNFLPTALGSLEKLTRQQLRAPLMVQFAHETAEDHGGPRRDFFGGIGSRLVSDTSDFWRRCPMGVIVPVADSEAAASPRKAPEALRDVWRFFRSCGLACALALKYGDVIGEEIAGFFLHQVARDDSVDLDELMRQLWETDGDDVRATGDVLNRNLVEVGLGNMTLSRVLSGTTTEVDLVPGGRDVAVTEDNKATWLELHLHDKLYGSLKKAADAFRDGLMDVFGGSRRTCPLFVLLSPKELSRLLAGNPVSDEAVDRWRKVACVSSEVRQQASWLWELLEEGDEGFRSRVLKFTTGARRLSSSGLQMFEVQPADGDDTRLPHAMTCANMLQLPRYSSKEMLLEQLQKATELCDSFQIL